MNNPLQNNTSFKTVISVIYGWILRHLEIFALMFCGIFILKINIYSWQFILSMFIVAVCSGFATKSWKNYKTNSIVMRSRKCKKSLHKSTYGGNAFTKGKTYDIIEEDEFFFYIKDNKGWEFSMHKTPFHGYYWVDEYFD